MKKLTLLLLILSNYNLNAQKINRNTLLNDIQTLSSDSFEGRKTGSTGNLKAADYITNRFEEIGLKSYNQNYRHPFTFRNRRNEQIQGINLIGCIKGKSENVIIISAHYDHVGINNSEIFNGADDNASGVAVILASAKYFTENKPLNTLLFVAFDAEEMGLQGAYSFLNNPPIPKELIKLTINLDMVSHNDKSELYVAGTFKSPAIKDIIQNADQNTGISIKFGHDQPDMGKDDWTMQSDHGPFAKENIPFLYFGVEDHKDYHKPSDDFDNINPNFFYSASTAILKSIISLDKNLDRINPK
ncbi:MAG: M28 family peptidase [Sphingobacterium thalpophilum]